MFMLTTPTEYQRKIFEKHLEDPVHALYWKMGRGKTKTTIDFINYAFIKNKINLAVVIAPKGVHENWVFQEIPKHSLSETYPLILKTNGGKKYLKEAADWVNYSGNKLKILTLNYDLLINPKVFNWLKMLILKNKTFLVLDESSRIKNLKTKRTKRILSLASLPSIVYKRILSGTPLTKNFLDLYTQYESLSPKILGFSSYYGYKTFICNIKKQQTRKTLPDGRIKSWEFEKILGFKNLDIVKKKISPFTSVVQDTSDLPPKIFYPTEVELKGEQKDFYRIIKNEIFITLQEAGSNCKLENLDTLLASDNFEEKISQLDSVTVDFILTKRIRLREILGGFIKTDSGRFKEFEENAKMEFLLEDIEDLDEKVIIWATFTYEIELLMSELLRKYSKTEVFSLYGKTRDYNETVESFKKRGKFLVANPAVGGMGFDIPQASINYYYSRDFNAQNFWQSQDRTHRIGQTKNVIYKIIVARNTVDAEIEKNLAGKYDTLKFFLEKPDDARIS